MREGWSDTDNASLRTYINETYKIYSPRKTRDALLTVATSRAYHPIKDYLDNLPPWDENPRVDNLLIDYLGAEDTPYTKAVIRKHS
jgi:Predicted P-loop ATPase and inactivated derivatives